MITTNEAKTVWDLVHPLKIAMLVTATNGLIQARPMHLVQSEFSGDFYFFTSEDTKKVDEIKAEDDVCLAFSCPKEQTYVSISGQASLICDAQLIDKFWNPFVAAWFPKGRDDPSLTLLKITTYQAEYWQGEGNTLTQLYQYAKASIKGTTPDVGSHGKIN
jgi:general stress protein 26